MKVIDNINQFEKQDFAIVTIGTFDGVHIGHQAILNQLVSEAHSSGGKSILITFWPHPRFVLKNGRTPLQLLSTFDEKIKLLESQNLDYLVKIPFTPQFSNLTPEEFVQEILVDRIGTKKLYIGYDHRFGSNRVGDINFLKDKAKKYSYEVHEIPRQDIDSIGVSSTKIREALHKSDILLANSLLGRGYSISGIVVEGEKVGRTIGFPTANIRIEESYKLLPEDGAYAVKAVVNGNELKGMMNIGFKPTVNGSSRTIEVHLFNFEQNIYDTEITIEFIESLRREMKFNSLEDLKKQLTLDKENALNILL